MNRTKGFEDPLKDKYTYCDDIKNLGADYSNNLIENNVSHLMFYNIHVQNFIKMFVEPYMVKLVNAVKFIRIYYNIAVNKNYKKIN